MNLSKYTTQELEFITSNVELLKKELEKRRVKELDDFSFKVGDVFHTKHENNNLFLRIKEIVDKRNNIVADEIIIRDSITFDAYEDEWYDIDTTEWHEYTKIDDSEIFENLLNIIYKYNDDVQQLDNDTYLKLKNEIAPYDN